MIAQTATLPVWHWEQLQLQYWTDLLRDLPAATVILTVAAGIIFLLYGRALFRIIIIINAAILAGYVGWQVGVQTRYPALFAAGFAVIFGLLAWPLFKLGVAVLCGLAGAALAGQIAPMFPHGEQYEFIYILIGFVVFAILGWLILMFAVTVLTALEGSTMIVLSLLELVRRSGLELKSPLWLPGHRVGAVQIVILVLAVLGIFYQYGLASRAAKPPAPPSQKTA